MLFIDEAGEGIEFFSDQFEAIGLDLSLLTDAEIRAFLSQLLRRVGVTVERSLAILRVGRTQYFADLKVDLPEHLLGLLDSNLAEVIGPGVVAVPRGRVDRKGRR